MTQYKVCLRHFTRTHIEAEVVLCKTGDRVKYHAIGGAGPGVETSTTTGEIVDIITETQEAGSTGVAAKVRFESGNMHFGRQFTLQTLYIGLRRRTPLPYQERQHWQGDRLQGWQHSWEGRLNSLAMYSVLEFVEFVD